MRYPGGKSHAVEQILMKMPDVKSIVSPFFGGGSVEIACADRMNIPVYGYDLFLPLVKFWQCEKEDPSRLADVIESFHPLMDEQFKIFKKDILNLELDDYEVAAKFFILNRSSFSGLTLSGGKSPGFQRFTKNSISKVRRFECDNLMWVKEMDFEESISSHPDSFIFADPPYMIEGKLYGRYGDLHFGMEDHERLRSILSSRDRWMLCYNDCEKIRDLYEGFEISCPEWSYGISKRRSSEILILSV